MGDFFRRKLNYETDSIIAELEFGQYQDFIELRWSVDTNLLSINLNHGIYIWNRNTGKTTEIDSSFRTLTFSPNSSLFAVATFDSNTDYPNVERML